MFAYVSKWTKRLGC